MANGSKPSDPAAPGGGITDADIDALLAEMNKPAEAGAATATAPAKSAQAAPTPSAAVNEDAEIDALLASATFENAPASGDASSGNPSPQSFSMPSGALPLNLPDLQRAMGEAQASSIDLLRDVELNVKIELGRSRMLVEDVLKLAEGSVVELDKLAGDPVDVFVNDRLVARGEVLVLNDSFCVRVNEIVANATADLA